MDPITITTAIVGLLTAAGKVTTLLEAISSIRNSPEAISDARTEVRHAEIALRSMQSFIENLDAAASRQRMIQVDDLRVTLADAMLAFSSFEGLLLRMAGSRPIFWHLYKTRLEEHLIRIQRYKLSLTLMLSVLQWYILTSWLSCDNARVSTDSRSNSDEEANQDRRRLENLIEMVLVENAELQQKLNQSSGFSCSSISYRHPQIYGNATIREFRNIDEGRTGNKNLAGEVGQTSFGEGVVQLAFENVLQASPVYLRHKNTNECDVSFSSTAQRSHAWSALASYSLDDVSVLSVIAMPLTAADISTGAQYYTPTLANKDASKRSRRVPKIEINLDDESIILVGKLWPALHF